MAVFLDTSAILPILHADDQDHTAARDQWAALMRDGEVVVTTNYVIVESCALIARRFGMAAVQALQAEIVPALETEWIAPPLHGEAMTAMLTANRSDLSLVDCVSFAVMRRRGLRAAFAFDRHFDEQGFRRLPG
jgi:predicted nucleic acid-binding protein